MINSVIAKAVAIAGTDNPTAVIDVLARMVIVATHGMSAGFSRLPPARRVELNLDDRKRIE